MKFYLLISFLTGFLIAVAIDGHKPITIEIDKETIKQAIYEAVTTPDKPSRGE